MDSNELFQTTRSPRSRELQGPRPPPLRVSKDSHKIKKPPVPPGATHSHPQRPAPPRQPVIIYAVSPKVIHTNPSEFMSLVQRLTGPSPKHSNPSSSSAPPVDHSNPFFNSNGAVSPAARYASVERAVKYPEGKRTGVVASDDVAGLEGFEMGRVLERTGLIPGILSPEPASLQPVPASFFSPLPNSGDPNPLGFLQDNNFSPAFLYNNKSLNFAEISSLLQSPTPFVSPRITSPAPSMDLFNNFFDL